MRLSALALALTPALAASQAFGPIETRNMRSLSIPFLRIDPRPYVSEEGVRTLSFHLSAANDVRRLGVPGASVEEDYELNRLLVRYRTGLGKNWDLTLDVPILSRGGGILDPFIQAWHDLLLGSLPGNPRSGTPFGRSLVQIPGRGAYGASSGIGDLSGSFAYQVDPTSMLMFGLKLPTGQASRLLGSGNVDAAIAGQKRVRFGKKIHLDGGLGWVFQGPSSELPRTRGIVHQEWLSLSWQPNSKDNWVFQWQSEASALVTGVPGSDSTHRMLSLAWQRNVGAGKILELYFSEDGDWHNYRWSEVSNIAPDFTAGIRYTLKF